VSDAIGIGLHEEPAPGHPVEVLIARHPQVVANVEGRFVGTGESPFTEVGEQQCRALARYIADWGPCAIHTSPRHRAAVVAEMAADLAGVPLHVNDGLAEISFGKAEGMTYDEATAAGVAIDLLGGPPESAPFHDGETWRSFVARVSDAADSIKTCGPRIAVVTHGGVFRALLTHWLDLPESAAWHFAVPNASVGIITLWDGTGTLRSLGIEPGATQSGDPTPRHHGLVWDRLLAREKRIAQGSKQPQ